MDTNQLTDIELRRYSRQIKLTEIGKTGQLALKKSKVLVIGAGGLGTPVLQYLAAAGVGILGICDNDYVNESNFHRQIMYGASDLGKLKTIVAKEKLKLLNPLIDFNIHNIQISIENAEYIIKEYDIIVDCTANNKARQIIAETCLKLSLPLVIGSVNIYSGAVCVLNKPTEQQINKISSTIISENPDAGIVGVVPGIFGCIQANEVIKLLLGKGDTLSGKILAFDTFKMKIEVKPL